MPVRRLHALPFLALLALAAACDEGGDPAGPGSGAGSLAFSHAGTGEAPSRWETHGSATGGADADWAVAIRDGMTLGISANRRTAGAKHDDVAIGIELPSVGSTYAVGDCDTCAVVGFTFGQPMDGASFDRACALTAGTLKLTTYSEERAAGTFSGTGTCVDTPGEAPEAITITNGSFDVPIHESDPV